MNEKVKLSVGLACMAIISGYMLLSVASSQFNLWSEKIAVYYITEGWKELAASNTVTSIVWEFRGYDTLGEETVLFTAAMGVFALGFGLFSAQKIQEDRAKPGQSDSRKEVQK